MEKTAVVVISWGFFSTIADDSRMVINISAVCNMPIFTENWYCTICTICRSKLAYMRHESTRAHGFECVCRNIRDKFMFALISMPFVAVSSIIWAACVFLWMCGSFFLSFWFCVTQFVIWDSINSIFVMPRLFYLDCIVYLVGFFCLACLVCLIVSIAYRMLVSGMRPYVQQYRIISAHGRM